MSIARTCACVNLFRVHSRPLFFSRVFVFLVSILIIFVCVNGYFEILKMQIIQCFTFGDSVSMMRRYATICVPSITHKRFLCCRFTAPSIIAVLFVCVYFFRFDLSRRKKRIYYFLIQFFSAGIDKPNTHSMQTYLLEIYLILNVQLNRMGNFNIFFSGVGLSKINHIGIFENINDYK